MTTFFVTFALLIACVGVYGLVSYGVVHRTAEFGVRVALGARTAQVVQMVLLEGSLPLGIGLVVGSGLSVAGAKIMRGLLFGLASSDPSILVFAASVTSFAAILAACLPARRAARIDPTIALSTE